MSKLVNYASALCLRLCRDLSQNKRPTKTVLAARARVLRRLRTAINRRYGSKYSVEQFGSTVYGVDSAASDMDLVLLVSSTSA